MNTSQFMDKQIMDLSNSQRNNNNNNNNDFLDLINPDQDREGGGAAKSEGIVPSYDFQPIRPLGAPLPSNFDSSNGGGARVWNSADSKTNASAVGIRNYGSLDSVEPGKVIIEKDHYGCDSALVSEIDRTMKKHADTLLHALEGVSARLSQLESRTHHIENSVDDLKESVGNNNGSIDGKMRQLENLLREVQVDVNVIRDKQEIMEAQFQLGKLQVPSKAAAEKQQPEVHVDPIMHHHHHQAASAPHQQLPPPPNAPPPLPTPQQNPPPGVQLQNQFPPNQFPSLPQRDPYFPTPPGPTQDVTANQPFLLTAPHQQQQQQQLPPPALPPQQQYQPQPPPHQQYSQPPPPLPHQQHPSLSMVNPPQTQQPPLGHHHPEEMQYGPPQNYPPSLRQPSGPPSSQQFHGTPSHVFDPPPSIHGSSGFSSAYGPPPSGPNDQYPYGGGSPSRYGGSGGGGGGGSTMKPHGSGYPQLPTARILPQAALPTASGVGSGSGSGGTGNRVPLDDVIEKVTSMGFSREQVRGTVRKLTENGQSVDLNVVLDKLMNDGGGGGGGGGDGEPQRSWFGGSR